MCSYIHRRVVRPYPISLPLITPRCGLYRFGEIIIETNWLWWRLWRVLPECVAPEYYTIHIIFLTNYIILRGNVLLAKRFRGLNTSRPLNWIYPGRKYNKYLCNIIQQNVFRKPRASVLKTCLFIHNVHIYYSNIF